MALSCPRVRPSRWKFIHRYGNRPELSRVDFVCWTGSRRATRLCAQRRKYSDCLGNMRSFGRFAVGNRIDRRASAFNVTRILTCSLKWTIHPFCGWDACHHPTSENLERCHRLELQLALRGRTKIICLSFRFFRWIYTRYGWGNFFAGSHTENSA